MKQTRPYILMALWAWASPAVWAQETATEAGQEAGEEEITLVQAPQLRDLIPAQIPPGTVFPSPEVEVVMEIEVSVEGKVTSVGLVQGPGEPFNGAALDAARQFSFEPALLSNGERAPVTVTFRMRIQEPPPPPPDPVRFEGRLRERGTRKDLAGEEVVAKAGEEILARATTDQEGRFRLEVPASEFEVVSSPAQHEELRAPVKAGAGEMREETFYLEAQEGKFETVVRTSKVYREVTKQVIPKEVVARVAGTQGDTLKVVQNMPGVARASFGAGTLILRGASPGDSRIFLEGQEIPILYHFGGLRSTFNSAFLEAVEFIPGNFGPDYGRATGGIVEVRVRNPARDTFRGEVDLNFYDAGFVLEGPLSENWSMGGAFHRSWIDALLPLVLPDDVPLSFNSLPRYYDYQLVTAWQPDPRTRLRLIAYGSLDKVSILFDRPQSDPVIRGDLAARVMFHNVYAGYQSQIFPLLKQETSAQYGYQEFRTDLGPDLHFNLDVHRFSLRTAWELQALTWMAVRLGMDMLVDAVSIDLNSPLRPVEGENLPPLSTQSFYGYQASSLLYQPALFGEVRFEPVEGLTLTPSLRVDYYRDIEEWTFDPRFVARYEFIPGTVVKGGVGYYQQPPSADQTVEGLGNPQLMAPRSLHASLGAEQSILNIVTIELTGFYKHLDRLVIRNPLFFADPEEPPYVSQGTGRIFGLEALVKAQVAGFTGWIAYTFQRSFRTDGEGAEERPFDFDQPHILTVVGTYDFGYGWSAGLRFRVVSGNPDTPLVGSVYDATSDTFVALFGETNSDRLATFHQLDLRVDKTWTFDLWKLSLYLDVQNVYYHGNQEGWTYNYDYSQRVALTGLPILPILGIKGEW